MKKLLISILLSLLSLLFIFVSCTSQRGGLPQGTTAGEVPAGSDISPDETTAENEIPPLRNYGCRFINDYNYDRAL